MSLLSPQAKVRLTYFLYAVAIAGAAALLILGLLTLKSVDTGNRRIEAQQTILQDQVAGQKEVLRGVQQLLANQGLSVEEMNKSFDCFLTFLGTPNRTNLYISNYSTCTITNTATGETRVLQVPTERPAASNTPADTRQQAAGSLPGQEPQAAPVQPTLPVPSPITPPGAIERLGYILNDTLGEVPEALKNVFQLITPKGDL